MPRNLDAERAVLGVLLKDGRLLVETDLRAEEFYLERHRDVFAAIRTTAQKGIGVDPVTVNEALLAAGKLAAVGGEAFVEDLCDNVGSTVTTYFDYHCKIVRAKAHRRAIIDAALDIASKGYAATLDDAELTAHAERSMLAALACQGSDEPATFATIAGEFLADLYARMDGKSTRGYSTGLPALDQKIGGLKAGRLYVVAGAPGMGKTALGMDLVMSAAYHQRRPFVFSLEMTRIELFGRRVAAAAAVDGQAIDNGALTASNMASIVDATAHLSGVPVTVDDRGAVSMTYIASQCRRNVMRHGPLGLVVVDYVQLTTGTDKKANRERQVAEVTTGLKALAKELDCPVVALSQLNRQRAGRKDERPVVTDLRDSGAVEADADVIIFVYRDEVVNKDSEDHGKAELIVEKQRGGPTGTVKVKFNAKRTTFEDLEGWHD